MLADIWNFCCVVFRLFQCDNGALFQCPFGHYDCMTKVTPDEVAQAVLKACGVS